MAKASRYGDLCRAELRLEYLHANSTTHDFLFGAVAELIDNSRDAGATRLDIFTGEATDLVYFGRSSKRTIPKMIGHYGNGLKSGSMRIGKDFILFTKKENIMTCLLFSRTFCEREGLNEIIVPIPSWSSSTRNPIIDDPQKFATQLSIICKYAPFNTEAELLKQFDAIYGESGTLVVIYNLKFALSGEPEFDVWTDEADLLIAGAPESLPEQRSLRAYTAILYFDPRMRIFIQAKKVETKRLPYCFYRPRKYPYISSSFKEVARNELQKAEMEVKTAEDTVKEAKCTLKRWQDSLFHENSEFAQGALLDAIENEKRMRGKFAEKQRNLRQPKKLFLIFGINIQNRCQDGMLIYSNNRLIQMFEKAGPQQKRESYFGAGAIGMVDVPLEIMEPTHNKQAFANVKEYNHLLKSMGQYLVQYWKDIGISQRGETLFWNDFGYLNDKWNEKPSDTIQYKRRRAVEIPDIVQCDICLKWRLLSFDTDINNGGHHGIWNCAKSPNPLENKCNIPERLPSIPLGTFNPPSRSVKDRQKLLIDSIQQRKRKLEYLSQKLHLIQPHTIVQHTDNSKTPAKNKNENVKKRVCRRKAFYKDPSPACRLLIKSGTNKGRIQNSSHQKQPPAKQKTLSRGKQHPCQEEEYSLAMLEDRKDHNMSMVLPLKKQDEQPYNEKLEVIKIETDSEPEVICVVISDSDTEDLPKYEEYDDFAVMHKEEKSEENGDSCFSHGSVHFEGKDLKSGSTEASKEDSKEQVFVAVKDSSVAVSQTQETSQGISENTMIKMLTSHIKEILLYFLPECELSVEQLMCMSTEDILVMFKLKDGSEQNKNVTLYIDQYLSQYEGRFAEKIQSVNQCALQIAHAIEGKIALCELQIKDEQEKLEHLWGKLAKLLLKIDRHPLINNLEDIDSYLEEFLLQENLSTFAIVNTCTTEASISARLGEESETSFNTM
ncbi:MORC family CW-type zinc finger protein 1 isoform X2 [Hemicordylus capensis]|uniref:MORC family CW-type zinc finger protein 1 isoform X2 n=1 Tax=Hemicordylus capensis TaxID=884348 RepID=UPI00230290ED|nr:MORC family CW-type zinc finger protein 1 isoform X2 [Hemicordylus capensis]